MKSIEAENRIKAVQIVGLASTLQNIENHLNNQPGIFLIKSSVLDIIAQGKRRAAELEDEQRHINKTK